MRMLLSWLREYVDVPFRTEEMAERLPMLGIGVDAVERLGPVPHGTGLRADAVFDLEIAANRGDLMSVLGVAREIAAATRTAIRRPAGDSVEDRAQAAELARVEVEEPDLCPRYTARMIVDVQVRPSPRWMARRLEACGIRSINNIVDVTNYVMLEMGQPMHAFDYDRLQGGRIVVRRAAAGEHLTTLDGVGRVLDRETLVIADAERAVGIAGVIGGGDTEIGPSTRRVLLEAASFTPVSIRRTSKRLGIRTESSARFERGVDTAGILAASVRAIRLIQETAGGRILRGAVDIYPAPLRHQQVELRWSSVARLLGVDVPFDEGMAILRSLGFGVEPALPAPSTVEGGLGEGTTDRTLRVQVPSFRRDVEREEDLIEEVARHYGYERIPEAMPVDITAQGTRTPALEAAQSVRDTMIRAGLTEALTISLTNPSALDSLLLPAGHPWRKAVKLLNPLVEDHAHLRTTLLPGLLGVARINASRRVTDVHVFELGRTFHPADGAVTERRRLAVLLMGRWLRAAWNIPAEAVTATYYHLKGIVESLLDELRIAGATFAATPSPWLHPGRAAQLTLDGETIGTLGELHPQVAAGYDLPSGVYVADLDLEVLLRRAVFRPQFSALPRFPSVRRDIALVVATAISAHQVEEVITAAGGRLLESVELFDVYTGPPIPEGHRNLAYALSFRASERTLAADEVDSVITRIAQALTERLRAKIRE